MTVRVPFALLLVITLTARAAEPSAATQPAKLKSQTVTVKCVPKYGVETTDLKMELLQLPAGKVVLKDKDGKDREHAVKTIWMSRTEVTWNQYDIFWQALDVENPWEVRRDRDRKFDGKSRPSKPYEPPDAGWGHDGYPAMGVHAQAAKLYVAWLSEKTRKKFRLPTEAEWEYACRAGGPAVKLDKAALDKVAWFEANSEDEHTHPVAKKAPNAWGFYDMLGNVAEYVIVDPDNWQGVAAGGSFQDPAERVHSGAREPYGKGWQRRDPEDPHGTGWLSDGRHVGLRVVMEE